MSQTNDRLAELGIQLPSAPAPAGNYVPAMQVGKLLYLSGAICFVNGEMTHTGKIGEGRDIAYGQAAARVCAPACSVSRGEEVEASPSRRRT